MDKGYIRLPQQIASMPGKFLLLRQAPLTTGHLLTVGHKLTILATRKVLT